MNKMKSMMNIFPVLFALSGAPLPAAEAPPLKVFVLVGTSNMHGRAASVDKLPEDLREPRKELLGKQGSEWVPLEPGKNIFGNETTFGQAMTRHFGQPIGIIKIGGVGTVSSGSGGAFAKGLLADAEKNGRPIVIAGMLLDVSFGDGNSQERAKAYEENLARWIETTRRDIGNATLPIVMNRAIPPVPGRPSHLEVVRNAQDALKLKLPAFRVFDCDDVPRGNDKVHITTEGQLEMGKRFAAAMIELLEQGKSAPATKKE
jgi:hypothetical protein